MQAGTSCCLQAAEVHAVQADWGGSTGTGIAPESGVLVTGRSSAARQAMEQDRRLHACGFLRITDGNDAQ